MLLNLAGNARDAIPEGGTLTIATANVHIRPGDVEDTEDVEPGEYCRISVADAGVGMVAITAARVFEPFFTTKDVGKGTGLGLSLVYGFARQAGGFCRVKTELGRGCAVELFLPRAKASARPLPAVSQAAPLREAADGEVVLIVEDESAVREMVEESLRGLGMAY